MTTLPVLKMCCQYTGKIKLMSLQTLVAVISLALR